VISGFTYGVIAAGANYSAVAIPASQGAARYGYYSTPDAVVRWVALSSLAPPNQSGNPVQ